MRTQLAKYHNREYELTETIIKIHNNDEPDTIRTPNGDFDNEAWLDAELDEIQSQRKELQKTITPEGRFVGLE